MSTTAMIGSAIFGAGSALVKNAAITEEAEAAGAENVRQARRTTEIAREKRSDVARQADQEIGTILATMADSGATTASVARAAGFKAGIAGLDKARISSNQLESLSSLRSANKNLKSQARMAVLGNTLSFFAKAGETAHTAFKPVPGSTEAPLPKKPVTKINPRNTRGEI